MSASCADGVDLAPRYASEAFYAAGRSQVLAMDIIQRVRQTERVRTEAELAVRAVNTELLKAPMPCSFGLNGKSLLLHRPVCRRLLATPFSSMHCGRLPHEGTMRPGRVPFA